MSSYSGLLNIIETNPYGRKLYSSSSEHGEVPPPVMGFLIQDNGFFITQDDGFLIEIT
jgi:hypothetical protein